MKPFAQITILLLISPLLANAAQPNQISTALSLLWQLDATSRQQFRSNPPVFDGHLQINQTVSNPLTQLCDHLGNGGSDAIADGLKHLLDTNQMLHEAAQLYSVITYGKDFVEAIRTLWFQPKDKPAFGSLFCRFSADFGTWHSYLRDRPQHEILEMQPANDELVIRLIQADGKVRKRRILLGSSFEFEFSAISMCALLNSEKSLKHCAVPLGDGRRLMLEIKTNETASGQETVEAFSTRIVPHAGILAKTKPKPRPNPVNAELQKLVDELWEKDVDRAPPGTICLNWQGKLHKDQIEDISPDPLFSYVNESFLERPIYSALLEMYEENAFHQQVCEQEPPMTADRRAKFAKLWGLIVNSEVFKAAYNYLDKQNKTGGDFDGFCATMFDFWFGTYSRCKSHNQQLPLGSSGFEHVFSGEWRQDIVEGHHNWVHFFLQEKAGDINYHGYFVHQEHDLIGTFQYKWKNFLKRIGGFFFQTSPAFDFSLFTVCVLTQPGSERCRFELLNTKLFVTSFTESCQNGTCIATTYPGIF